MQDVMMQVRDLVYEYPNHRALHGVSFVIKPATVTALVGPNGAGKTTLLRCMAALQLPYSGQVLINGLDTAVQPREVHRHLGFLSDFFGLYDELTVRQCLQHAAGMHGIGRERQLAAVERVAGRLHLEKLLDRRARELSRGQRQRLAIAQAVVHEPPIALLDEPASGLDPEARASLAHLINQLREEGMTLVVSSHILSELEAYSTHMLVIRDGRIGAHRPLHTEEAAGRMMRLRLAGELQPVVERLGREDGVSGVVARDGLLWFTLAGGDAEQGQLL